MTTIGSSPAARSLPKRSLSATARRRCAEVVAAASALVACGGDYTIGTLPSPTSEPTLRATATEPTAQVYATDGHALYSLTTSTMTFGAATPLRGCDLEVVEITQNDHGEMWAAGFSAGRAALYRVDPLSGVCSLVSKFATDAPWALAFVPQPIGGQQRLLGELSTGLTLLDPTHGTGIQLAPAPLSRRAACDIVVGTDGFAYVSSLLDWTDDHSPNVLLRADPVTGDVLATLPIDPGPIVDGLAVWSDETVAFCRDGSVQRLTIAADHVARATLTTTNSPARFTGASSGWTDVVPR